MVYKIHSDKKPLEFHDWQLPSHSLATNQSTLATKIQRGVYYILNVTEAWELVYIIHNDKQPLEFHDWQLPSHSIATKQSTLATISKTYISVSEHRIEMGVGLYNS